MLNFWAIWRARKIYIVWLVFNKQDTEWKVYFGNLWNSSEQQIETGQGSYTWRKERSPKLFYEPDPFKWGELTEQRDTTSLSKLSHKTMQTNQEKVLPCASLVSFGEPFFFFYFDATRRERIIVPLVDNMKNHVHICSSSSSANQYEPFNRWYYVPHSMHTFLEM